MTRRQRLGVRAIKLGLVVATWAPGDGVTRYRFQNMNEPGAGDYDATSNRYATIRGIGAAEDWLDAFRSGIIAATDPGLAGPLSIDWSRGDVFRTYPEECSE